MSDSYVHDLGKRIEARWSAVDRDEEAFPTLVVDELTRTPPGDHLDPDALIHGLLDPSLPGPRQLAPLGGFGQPGVTLYYGRGFVIDVYFWNNAVPAIHNHPFSGVFTMLRGFSLHKTYTFEPGESLGARVRLGTIREHELTLLRESDRVAFSLQEHALIHSLVHVPNPSVSLVVRTIRTLEYFRYFPPSVALAMSEPDDWISRQLALLDMMGQAEDPAYETALGRFLAGSDFETAFRAISAAYGRFHGNDRTRELVDMARERHGSHADLIAPAIEGAARLQRDDAFRERFTEEGDRFVASILMCARNRDDVRRLLSEGFEGNDPARVLGSWAIKAGLFDPADRGSGMVLERLLGGEALVAILDDMRQADPEGLGRQDRAGMLAMWEESIFRPLLVGG